MKISLDSVKFPCIAAHRGSCGGNVPPNTSIAFEAALKQGASLIETDIARSSDGIFYMFHTGNELRHLGLSVPFEQTSSAELDSLQLLNEFGKPTQYKLDKFDDVLERLYGRCLINLDRCWQNWEEILPIVERHNMRDQIILKSPCDKVWIDKAREVAPRYAYMPIINEDITPFYEMGGNTLPGFYGAELVFSSEDSPVIKEDIAHKLSAAGKHAWGNAIQFSQTRVLSAGHTDDAAILGSPEENWGWLIDKGFDIIQTDWVDLLNNYLTAKDGKR